MHQKRSPGTEYIEVINPSTPKPLVAIISPFSSTALRVPVPACGDGFPSCVYKLPFGMFNYQIANLKFRYHALHCRRHPATHRPPGLPREGFQGLFICSRPCAKTLPSNAPCAYRKVRPCCGTHRRAENSRRNASVHTPCRPGMELVLVLKTVGLRGFLKYTFILKMESMFPPPLPEPAP